MLNPPPLPIKIGMIYFYPNDHNKNFKKFLLFYQNYYLKIIFTPIFFLTTMFEGVLWSDQLYPKREVDLLISEQTCEVWYQVAKSRHFLLDYKDTLC